MTRSVIPGGGPWSGLFAMPVPTDTYYNIKRLNVVFAWSSVALVATLVWVIVQDYGRQWREPQRAGKVWEAALVDAKIRAAEVRAVGDQIASLDARIRQARDTLAADPRHATLTADLRSLESDRDDLEFSRSNLKSEVAVADVKIQDARAAGASKRADDIAAKIAPSRQTLQTWGDDLARINARIVTTRDELTAMSAEVGELSRQRNALVADAASLAKQRDALRPPSMIGRASTAVRRLPLAQFLNPAERVQQVLLPDIRTDVSFKMVETIDRCVTCHVNIAKPDFAEPAVLGYLESQAAVAMALSLPGSPESRTAPAATRTSPGAVAMTGFWHAWAVQLAPELLQKPVIANRIKSVARTVGPSASVMVDGSPLASFVYTPPPLTSPPASPSPSASSAAAATPPPMPHLRNEDRVLIALANAWFRYTDATGGAFTDGGVSVNIPPGQDPKAAQSGRVAAMRYVQDLADSLREQIPADDRRLLDDRYRVAMTRLVNDYVRSPAGDPPLDASRVLLAHPRLDLYVDADSPHAYEAVGCSSCHDGSGSETDFVLSAHVPRPIWVDAESGEPVLAAQLLPGSASAAGSVDAGLTAFDDMAAAVSPPGSLIPTGVDQLHFPADRNPVPESLAAPTDPIDARAAVPIAYVDPVTGGRGKAVPQLQHWARTYEAEAQRTFEQVYHEWDRPMRPGQYVQANCLRCHTEAFDIRVEAPKVVRGRALYTDMGCVNCHQMDSIPPEQNHNVGPDLRRVAEKLSPAFINSWIWSPKSFRPSTKMPHFFMLENNSSDAELARTRQEARAMTEYLLQTASPPPAGIVDPPPLAEPTDRQIAAGRTLFNAIGCLGCHANLNDTIDAAPAASSAAAIIAAQSAAAPSPAPGSTPAASPAAPATLARRWITQDLIKSTRLDGDIRSTLGGDADAKAFAAAVTAKAESLYDAMTWNQRQWYIAEHFPAENDAPATYPDGSPKPIFARQGPELSATGTKLLAGRSPDDARRWLFNWLKNPQHYSPLSPMPSLRLSDVQAAQLTQYLLAQRRGDDSPDSTGAAESDAWTPALTTPDPAKLRELVSLHLRNRYTPETAFEKANDDAELTALATDALTTPAMPRERASAVAASMPIEQRQLVYLGKRMIDHYGCMSCHAINGTETLVTPGSNLSDWGQKQVSMLDFGFLEARRVRSLKPEATSASIPMVNGVSTAASKLAGGRMPDSPVAQPVRAAWPMIHPNRADWLSHKLRSSRIIDRGRSLLEPDPSAVDLATRLGRPLDKTRMPTFYLQDDEVDALVTFILSNRARLISPELLAATVTPQASQIARGRWFSEYSNCVGCHSVDGNTPAIHAHYKPDDVINLAPPSLRGTGNKVRSEWMHAWLQDVTPLRPLMVDGARMPSFAFTPDQARVMVEFFAAMSNREAQALSRHLEPVRRYVAAAEQADRIRNPAKPAATDPRAPRPGDDWYRQPSLAASAAFLRGWAIDNRQVVSVMLDDSKNDADSLALAYRQIIYKAEFTADLYASPYPFTHQPRPVPDPQRFALGERFFHDMQCLSCHYLGEPAAGAIPKAPNLHLSADRLQQRWIRAWVQEPSVMQIGTSMPQAFSGLTAFNPHGQTWARAQNLPPDRIAETEKLYGASVNAQTDLLMDFLYHAGRIGHTSIPPTTQAAGVTTSDVPAAATSDAPASEAGPSDARAPAAIAPGAPNPPAPTVRPDPVPADRADYPKSPRAFPANSGQALEPH